MEEGRKLGMMKVEKKIENDEEGRKEWIELPTEAGMKEW